MTDQEKQTLQDLEAAYDRLAPLLAETREQLAQWEAVYEDYVRLREFYGSATWFSLREADLPIKAGILSEDAVYELIVGHNAFLGDLLDLTTKMYKGI